MSRSMSMAQATVEAMEIAMASDDRIVILGADIGLGGSFGQFRGLRDLFGPERVIDTPISEGLIVSACVGAAVTGLRPVASLSFVEFAMGAMDEIVNQAAKMRYMFGGQVSIPVVIRCSDGALRSSAAQHSESFEALFAHVPGLKVVAPSNAADAKGLLLSALDDDDPVIFLENKRISPNRAQVPEGDDRISLGKAKTCRTGTDVTVVTYSGMTQHAARAAEQLVDEGVDVEVLDLRTLVPLDIDTVIGSVARTRRAVVCHEAWVTGGFGAEIAARITEELFAELEAPVARVGARTSHIPFSPPLEREIVPQKEEIVSAVRRVLAATPRVTG